MNRSMLTWRIDKFHYQLITELTLKIKLLNANQRLESKKTSK